MDCEYRCEMQDDLTRHKVREHGELIKCGHIKCKRVFTEPEELREHLKGMHAGRQLKPIYA